MHAKWCNMEKCMYEPEPIVLSAVFPQLFLDLFRNETYRQNKTFIGYGNPAAKILILGKEITWKQGSGEYIHYCLNNFEQWQANLECQGSIMVRSEVLYPEDGITTKAWENFNPLFPHYLKYNKPARGKQDENNRLILATTNYGVTSTWLNYQKLIQEIVGYKSPIIDFLKHAFISELNELTRPNNKYNTQKDDERIEKSIRDRCPLLNEPFFRSFPVIIFAGRPYPRRIFKPLYGFEPFGPDGFIRKNRYDVKEHDGHLFIWTEQFSNRISNELIYNIANEVKSYLLHNNIIHENTKRYITSHYT